MKKWRELVASAWAACDMRALEEARAVHGLRLDRSAPKLRATLSSYLFTEYAFHVFKDAASLYALETMGVIRRRRGYVDFWVADAPFEEPLMKQLIEEAERIREVCASGCFQLCQESQAPLVFSYRKTLTMETLRRTAGKHFRVAAPRLSHLGLPLTRGLLEDQGVGAGAIVDVQ